jgi:hypothetical protein
MKDTPIDRTGMGRVSSPYSRVRTERVWAAAAKKVCYLPGIVAVWSGIAAAAIGTGTFKYYRSRRESDDIQYYSET